jgi:hypothetical protein
LIGLSISSKSEKQYSKKKDLWIDFLRNLFGPTADMECMKATKYTLSILWAAVAACGCLDLNLLDDMHPLDAGSGADTSGNGSEGDNNGDGNQNGQGTDNGDSESIETDPNDTDAPALSPASCGPKEQVKDFDSPAQASLLSGQWGTEHHAVVASLPDQADVRVVISAADVNGNLKDYVTSARGLGGPTIAITEVLADPNGTEPNQEFVEIANIGPAEVDLSGWMIDDNADVNGDLIPSGAVLAPGKAAILVSPAYDPNEGEDPAPAPGTAIIALPSSIGTSGLKNTEAETIELYDASGLLVSQYAGQAGNPVPGCSAVRFYAELPDGDEKAFGLEPLGTSTPGSFPALP